MKKLRARFDRFCYIHRNKGIPHLMLFLSIGSVLVMLFTLFSQNPILYDILCFNRSRILAGEVWRLLTFTLTYNTGDIITTIITNNLTNPNPFLSLTRNKRALRAELFKRAHPFLTSTHNWHYRLAE